MSAPEMRVAYNHGCRDCAGEVGIVGAERAGLCGDHVDALLARLTAAEAVCELVDAQHECEGCLNDQACNLGDALEVWRVRRERPS